MIAPPMKTRQDEPLRYAELARQGARIERSLSGNDLPRWAQLVDGEWQVQAVVEFYRDEQGLPWIAGEYEARGGLLCTRCSEVLDHVFTVRAKLCIVADEAQAAELADGCDVLVANGESVQFADIVEDELLLAVPEQLCTTQDCERQLPLVYPATGAEQAEQSERKSPFDVLEALKQ
jgi:uncharacterized metal-binding protein YceD (DUF177 family)